MKIFNVLAAIILLPAIAFAQNKPDSLFKLQIRVKNMDNNVRIYLAYQTNGKKIIDSANQNNGVYTFSGVIINPLNATLVTDPGHVGFKMLIKKAGMGQDMDALKFYIHPGDFSINADGKIANGQFLGSPINTDYAKLKLMLKTNTDRQIYISNQLRAGNFIQDAKSASKPDRPTFSEQELQTSRRLAKQLDSLHAAEVPIVKDFIAENPKSYIAMLNLQEYAGSYPDVTAVENIYNRFPASVKNTTAGKEFGKFLADRKNLAAGVKAPDFVQNDTVGKPVSLSSFKGKYVLLHFWASWCAPCRAENPELVQVFQDFKGRNFTILGVSLDDVEGKKAWLKAISDDHLYWTQVSDLRHWDNQVVKLYSVRAVPQSFLIDPAGVIIAKGLDNIELRKKLETVLPE